MESPANAQLLEEDLEARTTALQVDSSFIVQAPAGSGKTQLLIQRYLALLAHACEHPEQVLALSFTRKAAASMRESITELLRAAAAGGDGSGWLPASWELAQAAHQRSLSKGWKLLENPNSLRIGTIDSFCLSVCQAAPELAPLPENFQLSPNPLRLYQRAVRQVLYNSSLEDAWYPALDIALRHLDNYAPRLENLLMQLLAERDSWLGAKLADADAWRLYCQQTLQRCAQLISPALHDDLVELACTFEVDEPELVATQLDKLRQLVTPLLRAGGKSWRARPSLRKTQPGYECNRRVLLALQNQPELAAALLECHALATAAEAPEETELSDALLQLAKVAYASLKLLCAESAQIDYQQIASQALLALENDNWRESGSQHWQAVKHLLVDEFQDTSELQWRLLLLLSSEWSADGNYSIFLVGDPMQSIYRFRQCDLRLFGQIWEQQRMGQVPMRALRLRRNFRSHQALVERVNRIFVAAFPGKLDLRDAAVPYSMAIASRKAGVQPELRLLLENEEQRPYAELIPYLKDVRSQYPKASVALLIRQRTHAARLLEALHGAQLAYDASQLLKPAQQQVTMDLRSLLHALNDPLDELAWFALLRSPLCGCSLGELLALRRHWRNSAWDSINNPNWQEQLRPQARERVELLIASCAATVGAVSELSSAQQLEHCWRQLQGDSLVSAADDKLVDYFFFSLERSQFEGRLDFELLDDLLRQDSELNDEGDSADGRLQVMTIHQAKGLEFDYVALADLGQRGQSADTRGYLNLRMHQHDLRLFSARTYAPQPQSRYAYLQQLDRRQQQYETTRLLYVGCTRASQQLALHARLDSQGADKTPKPPRTDSLLGLIWPYLQMETL